MSTRSVKPLVSALFGFLFCFSLEEIKVLCWLKISVEKSILTSVWKSRQESFVLSLHFAGYTKARNLKRRLSQP